MSKPVKKGLGGLLALFALAILLFSAFKFVQTDPLKIEQGSRIFLVGGNLGSRMINYDHFETELHVRYPESQLFVRNMCDPGDTPGFRPRSARNNPWAFPGAEKFQTELANPSASEGFFPTDDEWLCPPESRHRGGFLRIQRVVSGRQPVWKTSRPSWMLS